MIAEMLDVTEVMEEQVAGQTETAVREQVGTERSFWADLTEEEKLGLNQDPSSPYKDHIVTHFWVMPDNFTVDTIGLLSSSRTLFNYDRAFPRVGDALRGPSPVVFFRVRGGIAFARHPEADLGTYYKAFHMLIAKTNKSLLRCGSPTFSEPQVIDQIKENLAVIV